MALGMSMCNAERTGFFFQTALTSLLVISDNHDDVIKWKHFPRYWPFVWGINRSPVKSPHKGQSRGALMFSLIRMIKRLSKQSWGWWFETASCSLWRHCNEFVDLTHLPQMIVGVNFQFDWNIFVWYCIIMHIAQQFYWNDMCKSSG